MSSHRFPPTSRRSVIASLGGGIAATFSGAGTAAGQPSPPPTRVTSATVDVRQFGAKGDQVSDDTTAFQEALDDRHAVGGGTVFAPPGSYRINGHLKIPRNVTLQGVLNAPSTIPWTSDAQGKSLPGGSILLAFEGANQPDGTPFMQLDYNATIRGFGVFYPEQKDADPPVPYPWTLSSALTGADNCSIIDVLLVNPYRAVDFGGRHTGRHYIRNLYGQPLYRGLFIDQCLDVGRVENVHFWPFWSPSGGAAAFGRKEGKAFIIGRTDWQHFNNCFCISYQTGFQFVRTISRHPAYQGGGNAMVFGGGADICNRAVHVEELQGHSGARFTNSQIYGDIIVERTNNGPLIFSACGLFGSVFGGNGVAQARVEGEGKVSFTDCHVQCIDPRNKERPLIHAQAGRLQIRGCEFIDGHAPRDHVVLEEAVKTAIVTENTSRGAFSVINRAKGKTIVANNLGEA